MNFLRKNRLAIQLTATLALSVWLPVWFLSGPGWNAYYSRMDLGPGGIGASAQADTPVARSIADMESLDKFRVERVQTDWQDSEGGVSLDDEKATDIAMTVSADALQKGIVIRKGKKVYHKVSM